MKPGRTSNSVAPPSHANRSIWTINARPIARTINFLDKQLSQFCMRCIIKLTQYYTQTCKTNNAIYHLCKNFDACSSLVGSIARGARETHWIQRFGLSVTTVIWGSQAQFHLIMIKNNGVQLSQDKYTIVLYYKAQTLGKIRTPETLKAVEEYYYLSKKSYKLNT